MHRLHLLSRRGLWVLFAGVLGLPLVLASASGEGGKKAVPGKPAKTDYDGTVKPILVKYCLSCHSTKAKRGSLDLERFATVADVRKDVKPWQGMIEQIESGEMPPKGKPQPTEAEKKQLLGWILEFLEGEARARAGDPGHVPLRRLSNAEYDATVRDLTGVDLRPTREFPADGAAGEGFTNAAEALTDISPALFTKYLNAAREIAAHAVLLPDGFRFSPSKTRRDWTDEGTATLRQFYAGFAPADGKLVYAPYVMATVRHRAALAAGRIEEIATRERLNAKYLGILWQALSDRTPSQPLDSLRAKWRTASEKDVAALVSEIAGQQAALWKTVRIGNYVRESWGAPAATGGGYSESLTRQVAVDPEAAEVIPLRVAVAAVPGQSEVVLHLAAEETGKPGSIVWQRPRLEAAGKPTLLLRDYARYGPEFEVDYATVFAATPRYLAAAVSLANDSSLSLEAVAKKEGLEAGFLKRWVEVLGVPARQRSGAAPTFAAVPLTLLEEKTPPNTQWPALSGWRKKGTDLPVVVSNRSDAVLQVPGRVAAHGISMHPLPQEFVAVVWKSPLAGEVQVSARIAHAHPACGNGVAWWIEHRRSGRAALLGEGNVDLGKEGALPGRSVRVEKGDEIVLAVDARERNHVCDMTEVRFRVVETGGTGRTWDLAADVADTIQAGNPHGDRLGNRETWSFARGDSTRVRRASGLIPAGSVLHRWREAAADASRDAELLALAEQVQRLLVGPRPGDNSPDRLLYDRFVKFDGPLLAGVETSKLPRAPGKRSAFGVPSARFDAAGDLIEAIDRAIAIRLPAALVMGRVFVVEAKLPTASADRLVRVRAGESGAAWHAAVLASAKGRAYQQLVAGNAAFRRVFPMFTCFPQVVPTDEVVTLKMFHREDEPLERLFLNAEQTRRLDALWRVQRFVSRQPVAEYDYLPQFMGYTTQDTPKAFQQFFIDRKPVFRKEAEEFEKEEAAAMPRQVEALLPFAEKAFRRPLQEGEKKELRALYEAIRKKGSSHDEAMRGVLTRIFVSPAFLFRIEQAPPGKESAPVNDWELASRLSYFLWSSMPDDELRALAAQGKLREAKVLEGQVRRMLRDPRVRSLAIEFGTQWIHVRGFDDLKEKNEKLFPSFDAGLRQAIYEEAILFFQDLFQNDRPILNVLAADYTFLNDTLARHYGIPGVTGSHWRKVDGVRKYSRGGILGFASVQAKQAGASRTSPILRGNWVVETILGEKLPRPPANVPQLPEEEGRDKLTMRQLVERHARVAECAVCHVRIDQFGFALEKFDPIGRLREKELGGLAIDAKAKLRDGTEFEGIDGLREYLLSQKQEIIVRLFCRRLLGYALGRSVTLSDTNLLDQMSTEVKRNDGRISAALLTVIRSRQFTQVRGADYPTDQ